MRKYRLKEIQKILSEQSITSQEELIKILASSDMEITQATLSRDLAYLKVSKYFRPNVGYVYTLPQDIKKNTTSQYVSNQNLIGVLSLKFSRNIAVIKTLSGYAPQICVLIDDVQIPQCIGTIAGDDTIMIVLEENTSHEDFKQILFTHFPLLQETI